MVLGDRKPSTLLREMRLIAPEMDEIFLKNVWMERLPQHMRGILSAELGITADAICEHTSSSYIHEASTHLTYQERPYQAVTQEEFDKLVKRIEKLEFQSKRRSRSQSRDNKRHPFCKFHYKFGEKARNCEPCKFNEASDQKN